MPTIPELLENNYEDLSINDLIATLNQMAEKAETHIAFQGQLPEYVTPAPQLRQLATALALARDAAAGGDRDRVAEKKALMALAKQALAMNALHISMLSLHRNDPSILLNSGYPPKQKSNYKGKVNLQDLVPDVFAKHGAISGAITVLVKRAKSIATVEVQMTDKDPASEESWQSQGMYNRSRIELKGFEPAKRIHFRARYHEDGGCGRWSSPVPLIVL